VKRAAISLAFALCSCSREAPADRDPLLEGNWGGGAYLTDCIELTLRDPADHKVIAVYEAPSKAYADDILESWRGERPFVYDMTLGGCEHQWQMREDGQWAPAT
jgi:hypothetical protein